MFGLPMWKGRLVLRDCRGRSVFMFTDTKGRQWMAYHRWDLWNRVRVGE